MARSQQVGWEVEFGDWQGFLHATEALIRSVNEQPQTVIGQLQALSDQVRQLTMGSTVKAWKRPYHAGNHGCPSDVSPAAHALDLTTGCTWVSCTEPDATRHLGGA